MPEKTSSPSGQDHPPIEVRDLNKRYKGGTWANRDITLSARPGEILGILGPNGAGKTTLVRQITTEIFPTSGEALVFGHDVVTEPIAVKSLMGIMPQEASIFEYLTVYHHFRIFGKLRGFLPRQAKRRADELVQDLGLSEQRNVLVGRLSGGQRRRVLVGIASLAQPPLMVMDEPTTGLDPQARRQLWALFRRYRATGATVLLTTHYMEEAELLCDRVGIINHGRLLALDTVDNLRSSYGYEYRISFSTDGSDTETETMYGADDRELVEQVRAKGVHQYSVARTSLEDIYLALTGDREVLSEERS